MQRHASSFFVSLERKGIATAVCAVNSASACFLPDKQECAAAYPPKIYMLTRKRGQATVIGASKLPIENGQYRHREASASCPCPLFRGWRAPFLGCREIPFAAFAIHGLAGSR
jgi:hypothetical protein